VGALDYFKDWIPAFAGMTAKKDNNTPQRAQSNTPRVL
jgi:hypothetical protein